MGRCPLAKRTRWTWLLSAVALVAGFALLTAAYGVGATKKTPQSPAKSQAFGNFRAVLDTIDSGDPAIAYTGQAWWAFYDVYQTLLTYKHVEGAAGYKLVPGLATSLPKITRSGKLYTFKLRAGLKYS